jgi:hypothetical protein
MWRDIAQSCCWWWCYENYVVISERPTVVCMQAGSRGVERIHCVDGPAIAFADGWEVFALNGVRVPQWIVETPAQEIDPKKILTEQNAEVRREILRKIGVERAIAALGAKSLDKRADEYELLEIDFTGRARRYLKMRNPSIGIWHVEPVHPDCDTIQQAINWRAYGDIKQSWRPSQLT